MVFWIVLLLIIAFILIIFAIPLRVRICFRREKKKNFLSLRIILLWGLIKYNVKEPKIFLGKRFFPPSLKVKAKVGQISEKPQKIKEEYVLEEIKKIYREIRVYKNLINETTDEILGKAIVKDLVWSTSIGFEEPAYTGIAYGLIWGGKSIILNYFRKRVKKISGQTQIFVHPDFAGKSGFSTNISCIFALRLGHIITAAMKNLVLYIFKRG